MGNMRRFDLIGRECKQEQRDGTGVDWRVGCEGSEELFWETGGEF